MKQVLWDYMEKADKLDIMIRNLTLTIHQRECRLEAHTGYSPDSEKECRECKWSVQKGSGAYDVPGYSETFFEGCNEADRLERRVKKAKKLKEVLQIALEKEVRLK